MTPAGVRPAEREGAAREGRNRGASRHAVRRGVVESLELRP